MKSSAFVVATLPFLVVIGSVARAQTVALRVDIDADKFRGDDVLRLEGETSTRVGAPNHSTGQNGATKKLPANKILLRLQPVVGTRYKTMIYTAGGAIENSKIPQISIQDTIDATTQIARADGNIVVSQHRYNRVRNKLAVGREVTAFDSAQRNPQTLANAIYLSMIGAEVSVYQFPDGRLASVDGFNDAPTRRIAARNTAQNSNQSRALYKNLFLRRAYDTFASTAPAYPDYAVGAGDSWTRTLPVVGWTPATQIRYTLTSRRKGIATISFRGGVITPGIKIFGDSGLDASRGLIKGTMQVDEKTGWTRLISSTMTVRILTTVRRRDGLYEHDSIDTITETRLVSDAF